MSSVILFRNSAAYIFLGQLDRNVYGELVVLVLWGFADHVGNS